MNELKRKVWEVVEAVATANGLTPRKESQWFRKLPNREAFSLYLERAPGSPEWNELCTEAGSVELVKKLAVHFLKVKATGGVRGLSAGVVVEGWKGVNGFPVVVVFPGFKGRPAVELERLSGRVKVQYPNGETEWLHPEYVFKPGEVPKKAEPTEREIMAKWKKGGKEVTSW